MAEEVEAQEEETTAANRIWLLPESISRERLTELRIRVMEEQEFSIPIEGQPAPLKVRVWGVSERAQRKLREAGYGVTLDEDQELKIKILVLTNPDGALSKVGVDPRTIKVVKMENNGMNAALSTWFKEQILAKLSPLIDVPITVMAPSNANPLVLLEEKHSKFQIAFGASPIMLRDGAQNNPPRTAWGQTTNLGSAATHCDVWYGGTPIISEDGVEVGALDAYNVAIYWRLDSIGANVDTMKHILLNILDMIVRIRANPNDFRVPEELVRTNYIRACSARLESEQANLKAEVDRRQKEVISYGDKLIESTRLGEHSRALLNGFALYTKDMAKRLDDEFTSLRGMKNVTEVGWRGDCLVVATDTIYVVDPRTQIEHDIGKFRILLDQRRSKPHMFNQTRRVDGMNPQMHHPHVFPAGDPCLGNMGEALPVALAQYQWTVVVQLCLVFLQHVNVEDGAGAMINKWPVSERWTLAQEEKKKAAAAAAAAKKGDHVPAA